jgi:hypothetical protein
MFRSRPLPRLAPLVQIQEQIEPPRGQVRQEKKKERKFKMIEGALVLS